MLSILCSTIMTKIVSLFLRSITNFSMLPWKAGNGPGGTRLCLSTYMCRALFVALIVLLPLLGLTWVFGILTVNANSTIFAWLFTIFNSLQVLAIESHAFTASCYINVSLDSIIGNVHFLLPCYTKWQGEMSIIINTQLLRRTTKQ